MLYIKKSKTTFLTIWAAQKKMFILIVCCMQKLTESLKIQRNVILVEWLKMDFRKKNILI